jgi:hypothetical protein
MTPQQAQGVLEHFLFQKIIRVNAGKVTVDDAEFNCRLNVLTGSKGIEISMTRGNTLSVNQGKVQGVVKGNTLTAKVEVSQNTLFNGNGNGYYASTTTKKNGKNNMTNVDYPNNHIYQLVVFPKKQSESIDSASIVPNFIKEF